MNNTSDMSFNDLVEKHLGKRLPPEMAEPVSMSDQPQEAKDFIYRLLQLMKKAGYSATSFSPHLIRWLSTIKTMLPCAWGGQIPPITMPNRHRKLDAYVKNQDQFNGEKTPVFLDLGCGFPPMTTSDTAKALPHWRVFGVDYSFPDYIVFNEEGHYACFDLNGDFLYFQAMMIPTGRELYQDPKGTRKYFNRLFLRLQKDGLSPHKDKSRIVEKDGCRLIQNHVHDFETDNLSFIKSDICDVDLPPVKVIRGMNVYIYFDPDTRKKMLKQTARFLDDDGIMIVGTNGLSIQTRYFVYKKNATGLFTHEFAFSPDNMGPISFMPWFTIHENDPEAMALAELSKVIRSNTSFWTDFSNDIDMLLKENEICRRGPDGFFQFPKEEMQFSEYMLKIRSIWNELDNKGYTDGAIGVLKKAGYTAWKNRVGDIAVKPLATGAL